MMKKGWVIIFLWILLPAGLFAQEIDQEVYLQEQKEKIINYEEIQGTMDQMQIGMDNGQTMDFYQLVEDILSGQVEISLFNLVKMGIEVIFEEVVLNTDLMIQVIMITIIIAIVTNFTSAFDSKYIGEVGFFVTYLILSALLIQTFQLVSAISAEAIEKALIFMQALVPSFFTAVSLSGNLNSSFMFHQTVLMIVGVIDWMILHLILPFINMVVVLEIANNMTEEHLLSKLTDLFKGGISWALKTLTAVFFGLNVFQSLTLPVIDTVANKSIKNVMQVVPVVGTTLDGVTDTVLGSTMLIKNAIGLGGVIILLIICFVPLLKIMTFVLIYKGVAAIIQPISNGRVVNCLSGIGDATKLLLGTVFTVALLFIISIAIISMATSLSYMAR